MTQSYAYRYGKTIGEMTFLQLMAQDGKVGAGATCQIETDGITASFVPDSALAMFPQWKDHAVGQHVGWFFLGLRAGCRQP